MRVVGRVVTDRDGRILEASPEGRELFGLAPRWLEGKPLASFIEEGDRRQFRDLLLSLVRQPVSTTVGLAIRRRDGPAVDAEAVVQPTGTTLAWQLSASFPEPAEPDLRGALGQDREHVFARLLARLPVGVLVVDRDLKVAYVNPAARPFFGRNSGLRIGATLPDAWPELSLRRHVRSLFGPRPASGKRFVSADEHVFAIEGIPAAGATTAILLLEDVTARERRRAAERDFVTNAAHELRTPVTSIAGAAEALRTGAVDDPEHRERFLSHIEQATTRLSRLTASLLVLARVQTGQQEPRLELVPVKPLLEELAAELEPAPGVTVELRATRTLGILADRELARQALWNIASNAVKHTREGTIVVEGRDLGRVTEVEIRDSGAGMSSHDRERALDRFYRGGRDGDGFGLGLTIASEIVRALGGRLRLESNEGVGTRVRVQLPSARLTRV